MLLANTDGSDMSQIITEIRQKLDELALPAGYFSQLEGQFKAQEEATQLMALLGAISLLLIFLVLYTLLS